MGSLSKTNTIGQFAWQLIRGAKEQESLYAETKGRPQRNGYQKPERMLLLAFADLCGDQTQDFSQIFFRFPFPYGFYMVRCFIECLE